jgi:hypothetical protein
MEYVAIGILVLLVVGGAVTALVMRATAGSTPASPESGDPTPAGDSPELSESDAGDRGGAGGPTSGQGQTAGRAPARDPEESPGNRFKRDPIGGEAESEPTIDTGGTPRAS